MDNLTHTLTGVLLARAGLNRLTPRAVAICAVAANIPDTDVVTALGGTTVYFIHHRWATHALVFAPLMAILPVLLVALILRQRLPWIRAWLASLAAVGSHLLLDYTNPYGIRLFLPFSDAWPALNITHVVDVWIWGILLLGVLWPMLSTLVGSEIGTKGTRGQGVAIAALCLLAIYDAGRFLLHRNAEEIVQSRMYDGSNPLATVVFPQNVNPMRWDGWVETERAWLKVNIDLTEEFDPTPRATFWKGNVDDATRAAARRTTIFEVFEKFARTPLWRTTPTGDGRKVELMDLRFGRNGSEGFTATAVLDRDGQVVESLFGY